jgi:hypothetical protein
MSGIFMGVYFAWSVMTVMSSRVFLNLVFVVHGRPKMTTGGLSTFRAKRTIRTEVEEGGQLETFGAKNIHHNVPLTTFTVSTGLYSMFLVTESYSVPI